MRLHTRNSRRRPAGLPGSAEVVNMQPPDRLLKQGIMSLRPSAMDASPEPPTALDRQCITRIGAGGGLRCCVRAIGSGSI